MRTIKFRAWNGEQMIYRGLHDRNWYSEDLGGKLVQVTHPDDKRLLSTMQFTGLLDKNGKEIYEGDILNICNGSINGNGWFDKPYSVEFKCGKWDIPLFMWDEDGKAIMNYTHWCEVIGNIHENPNLL